MPGANKVLAGLLLVFAVIAGALSLFWIYLDSVGTEWDFCGRGGGCIAGWKIGTSFIVVAAVVGLVGIGLLRRAR